MAEGWVNELYPDVIDGYSAGTDPHPLNALAVKVMSEKGVDISKHTSKSVDNFASMPFDLIITVCDNAAASCPAPPPGIRVLHVPFDDPPLLARDSKSQEEELSHYRRVRDEIERFVLTIPELLKL